ncbi:dihydrofolate reductase [Salinisphaera sp. Q1T1-3]|uniref:dihydrofolate reductase n=1 Tax=Salinisphaera sp. Q1T1-3 TaxID=2321229 RepID=UPI000E71F64D|nr:dihydrofolate reductase [Salinisphaera sp. Q1T1-3]RJS92361.1 dihydrofolate reductase [Salinisphaera sp. Q1T1-3]
MTRPRLTLIAAIADNGVIGADGGMPWHIPGDLPRFKRLTLDKPVLMGRRTHESIGKALPRRHNIVMSRRPRPPESNGVTWVSDLDRAMVAAGPVPEIMVMGGAEIYAQALPYADRMELTHIAAEYDGDTRFPDVDWSVWEAIATEAVAATEQAPAHRFVTWTRGGR